MPAQATETPLVTISFTPLGDWYESEGGATQNRYRIDVVDAAGQPAPGNLVLYVNGVIQGVQFPTSPGWAEGEIWNPVAAGVNTITVEHRRRSDRALTTASFTVTARAATIGGAQVSVTAPSTVRANERFTISVDVTAGGAPASGSVAVTVEGPAGSEGQFGGAYVEDLVDGHADIDAVEFRPGPNEIAVRYKGSAGVKAASAPVRRLTITPATFTVVKQPAVSGTPVVGGTLTASDGTDLWSPSPAGRMWQWFVGGIAVSGAVSPTFVVPAAALGKTVSVRVTATNKGLGYTDSALTSAPTAKVQAGTLTASTPTVSGAAKVGVALAAKPGTWTSGTTLAYQWKANGTAVAGATSSTFVPRAAQAGKRITVTVTGSKPGYTTASKTSAQTAAIAAANPQLGYQGHVQNIGWQPWMTGGQVAGTTGRSLRVEALRFRLNRPAYSGGITATAHVQNIGWMAPVTTGGMVGTTGRSLRVEAFTIKLTGEMAKHYDIYYRTHAQNFGWLGWAKNGAQSGTAGYAYRLEAVDVRLVAKGDPAPSGTGLRAFYQR